MSLDDEVKELKPPQQTVAATLVATVTLAAGFILPGSYWAQEGPIPSTPILSCLLSISLLQLRPFGK